MLGTYGTETESRILDLEATNIIPSRVLFHCIIRAGRNWSFLVTFLLMRDFFKFL